MIHSLREFCCHIKSDAIYTKKTRRGREMNRLEMSNFRTLETEIQSKKNRIE